MLIPLHIGKNVIQIDVLDGASASIENPIYPFVNEQVPEFVAVDHSKFVNFLEAYYEWMSIEGNPKYESYNLEKNRDVDYTSDALLDQFRNQFLANFPKVIESNVDQRKLIKNIKEFYEAKGTEKSYKLLFRILFNEDPDFYYPKADVFKASTGRWVEPTILKVTRTNAESDFFETVGKQVRQNNVLTGALESYGFIEGVLLYEKEGYEVAELELSGVFGTFDSEKLVEMDKSSGTINEYVYPTLDVINVSGGGGSGYISTDAISFSGSLGEGARAKITSLGPKGEIKSIKLLDSGINYRASETIVVSVTSSNGGGATLGVTGGVALDSRDGYYSSNDGVLSSEKKLQDNHYYQDFSYVIKSSKNFKNYYDEVKRIIHPAGIALFGDTLLKQVTSLQTALTNTQTKYETPLVGHYTPYLFTGVRNLRANGAGGSGGNDVYPDGYDGNTANTPIETSAILDHTPADWSNGLGHTYSGPLGATTNPGGFDTNGNTVGVYGPLGTTTENQALNTPQGYEQFDVVSGSITGGITQDYWGVYPHPNSRGITNMPYDGIGKIQEIYTINAPLGPADFSVGNYVVQETPHVQKAVGIVMKASPYGKNQTIILTHVLSGEFAVSGTGVIGGTTGLLVNQTGGREESINTIMDNATAVSDDTEFNFIKIEDFLFGIER